MLSHTAAVRFKCSVQMNFVLAPSETREAVWSINWTQKWNTTITPIKTVFILAGHVITPGASILHMQGTISYRMVICFCRHSRIKPPNRSTNQRFVAVTWGFHSLFLPTDPAEPASRAGGV